jgi:hypothetical protein
MKILAEFPRAEEHVSTDSMQKSTCNETLLDEPCAAPGPAGMGLDHRSA